MTTKLKWMVLSFFVFGLFSAQAQKFSLHFAQYPALTPDGQTLYFSYDGDIWKVATQGGTAERITGMEGSETNPKISPDGKWLAFSSDQYGNNDIYLLPLDGGQAKQLTFHQASDEVSSWNWDSNSIYFTSTRHNRVSTYQVNIDGGTPTRVFGAYFNTIHDLFPDPVTGELYFNYSWESYMFATRKGYKGPFNPNIQSYNPKTKKYKKYTTWKGKDFNVTIDRKGHVYFVSDQGNGQMNLYTFKDGKKTPLTQYKEMVIHPSVNADGGTIVFEKGYQLWAYDVASGKAHIIPIKGFHHNTLTKKQNFDVKGNLSSFDVSYDNKKMAFVSKGRLFVSDIEGKFIKEIPTKSNQRVLSVHWLKDNKTLLYSQTWHGFTNWFVQPADGSKKEKQITKTLSNNRLLSIGPKKEKAVYLRGRNDVCVLDLNSLKTTVVATGELWGFQNDAPSFSPDGKYVMYTVRKNFETDIMLCRLSDHKVYNITQTGVSESDPVFSPDGKYIYFISDRTHPSYPYGMQNAHLYRIALQHKDRPFRSSQVDSLFASSKKHKPNHKKKNKNPKKDDHLPQVKIDFDGLTARVEQVGPRFGTQRSVYVAQDGDKQIVLFTSNHEGGRYKIYQLTEQPFERDKTEGLSNRSVYGLNISKSDRDLYALIRGDIYKISLRRHKMNEVDMESFTFTKDLKQVFNQMFSEVWANLDENYYSGDFNGANWKEVRDRYATYLPYLRSRADLRRLLKDMMGELNTSHYGFTSYGSEERTYYHTYTAETGLLFDQDNPYTVREIVPKSPASYSQKDVRPGDVLVAVNGTKVDTKVSREQYFAFPKGPREMTLTFKRGGKTHDVKIHPESYSALKTQLYNQWIAHNSSTVSKESNQRIGYVYMKDMSSESLEKFMLQMVTDSVNRDGLIIDLRYNTGGNVHGKVLQFLSQRPYLQWKYRDGKMSPQPDFAPAGKPIVMLVNRQTLSDGEMTAAGFQALNLGTVVGTKTYHWIIFTSAKRLVDGSSYRLPSWGCYTLDGENLEKVGVTPDIFVDRTFVDRLTGKDPQLQKAISIIMKKLNQ